VHTGAEEHKSWSEVQGLQTFRKPSYQPNGNVFDSQGRLLTCKHESRAIIMTIQMVSASSVKTEITVESVET
jgi:gluconolactonase